MLFIFDHYFMKYPIIALFLFLNLLMSQVYVHAQDSLSQVKTTSNAKVVNRMADSVSHFLGNYEFKKALPFLDSLIYHSNQVFGNRQIDVLYNTRACTYIHSASINDKENNLIAQMDFDSAIKYASTQSLGFYHYNRGHSYLMLGNEKKSLEEAKKAVALKPNNAQLEGTVLKLLYIMDSFPVALVMCDSLIAKYPKNGYPYYIRGQIKRDYLHTYIEGNKDKAKARELGMAQGLYFYYWLNPRAR